MSNIPNSAMPHAWAHDDEDDERRQSANQEGFSLVGVALASAVAATVYFFLRRK